MSSQFVSLEKIDGSFIHLSAPSVLNHHRVIHIWSHLRSQVSKYQIYPEEEDFNLFPLFRETYEEVARAIDIKFNPAELTYKSRHHFFICTEPIPNPDPNENNLIPGLSLLHELLGFKIQRIDEVQPSEYETEMESTGDPALDVVTDTLLIFKKNAWNLIKEYSLSDLVKICKQASWRLRVSQEEMEEKYKHHDGKSKEHSNKPTSIPLVESYDELDSPTQPLNDKTLSRLKSLNINLPPT